MKTEQNNICPNCWGFQEYDEAQLGKQLYKCK